MKNSIVLFLMLLLGSGFAHAQKTCDQLKQVNTTNNRADYQIDGRWMLDHWTINPKIKNDVLTIRSYGKNTLFKFRTDSDSISIRLKPGEQSSFCVVMPDKSTARTTVKATWFEPESLSFNRKEPETTPIVYTNQADGPYLEALKSAYPLDDALKNWTSELEKLKAITNWTHNRWPHNGNTMPEKSDGLSILKEAEAGGTFPCFAYATVLKDQLAVAGFKARVIGLKTKDAKKSKAPPGHVANEVYLQDFNKWVFVDAQFNVIPVLKGKPLNAVELQQAISENYYDLQFLSLGKANKRQYVDFVYPYLYYMDIHIDNSYSKVKSTSVDGKSKLMLVPEGAKNLTKINFWNMTIDYCVYTHSLNKFYAKPI